MNTACRHAKYTTGRTTGDHDVNGTPLRGTMTNKTNPKNISIIVLKYVVATCWYRCATAPGNGRPTAKVDCVISASLSYVRSSLAMNSRAAAVGCARINALASREAIRSRSTSCNASSSYG